MKLKTGLTVLEIVIAVGLFMIISTSVIGVLIGTQYLNKNSEERNFAKYYAIEGIEAVKAIKEREWELLEVGTYGLELNGSQWDLIPGFDSNGKYSRTITILPVYRDPEGNITDDSLNPEDSATRKIVSTVSWEFKPEKTLVTEYSTYVTNWSRDVTYLGSGMLVYSTKINGVDTVVFRRYTDSQKWSNEIAIPACPGSEGKIIRRIEIYSSPISEEKILILKMAGSGEVQICASVWDGGNWGAFDEILSHNNTEFETLRDFDGAYESSGNFIFIVSNDTNSPQYYEWDTSSWSLPLPIDDIGAHPVWIITKTEPNTDNIMLVVRDKDQKTITYMWDGNGWSSKNIHGTISTGVFYENIAYIWRGDNDNGGLMFNEADDNYPNIKIFDQNSGWTGYAENINVGGRSRMFRMAGHPNQELIVGCTQNENTTINCMATDYTPEWSSPKIRIAENNYGTEYASYDLSFEMLTGEVAVAVYSESTAGDARTPKYRIYYSATDTWSEEFELPEMGPTEDSEVVAVKAIPKKGTDDIMFMIGGKSGEMATVVWNGQSNMFYDTGGKGFNVITVDGPATSYYWFDFEWDNVE